MTDPWTCPNGCSSPKPAWWPAPPGGKTPPCSNCDAPLEIRRGARVEFCVNDAETAWAEEREPGAILAGRFLGIVGSRNWDAAQEGKAQVETNEIIDMDDDGMDEETGGPIMRPIYARYYVDLAKLTVLDG